MDAITVSAESAPDLERLVSCAPLRHSFDRLIVVDNASRDDSSALAQRAGATVIRLTRRTGYGTCVNLAAEHTHGESFAVFNPDIWFEDDAVLPALERRLARPGVGLVAPALVLPDGTTQDSARKIPTPLELALRRRIRPGRGAIQDSGAVPWVVGACFVVKRAAWEAVGGFDERYFLYFEDVDLCWRLRRAGWTTELDPSVRVRHQHNGASRMSLLGWATRRHTASAARFYRRNPRFLLSSRLPPVGSGAVDADQAVAVAGPPPEPRREG